MLFSSLVTAATTLILASSTVAIPTLPQYGHPTPRAIAKLTNLAKLMPANTLPPPGNLVLKFVGLGIGTQNYTCLTANATAAPGTTGALAKLYDLGTTLNNDFLAKWKLGSISALALSMKSQSPAMLNMYLQSQGYQQILGDHFFSPLTVNTPTFSLNKVKANPFPLAFVTKKDEMVAPKSACPGVKGEGAIKWLRLVDEANLSKGGINTVYRLETAGGSAPATCEGQRKTFEVLYAAQYWVYGPA